MQTCRGPATGIRWPRPGTGKGEEKVSQIITAGSIWQPPGNLIYFPVFLGCVLCFVTFPIAIFSVFSLFNVIQFNNGPCVSTSTR